MIDTVLRAFVLLMIATIVVTPPRARAGETAQPPFSASVSSGYAPLSVAFSYQYESTNSHWMLAIDFGDASSGEMQLPAPSRCAKAPDSASKCPGFRWQSVHAYEYPGIYVATLTRGGLPRCFGCAAPVLGTQTINVSGSR